MNQRARIRESNILIASDGEKYTVIRAFNTSIQELALIDIPEDGPSRDTELILNTIKAIAKSDYITSSINDGEKKLSQLMEESHYPWNKPVSEEA